MEKMTKSEKNNIIHKAFMKRFRDRLRHVEKLGYKINKHRSMGTHHYSVSLNDDNFGWGFDGENGALIWIEERENIWNSDNPKHPDFLKNLNINFLTDSITSKS